jgi:hypothetical protein
LGRRPNYEEQNGEHPTRRNHKVANDFSHFSSPSLVGIDHSFSPICRFHRRAVVEFTSVKKNN